MAGNNFESHKEHRESGGRAAASMRHEQWRYGAGVLKVDEIAGGADELGVLLMGHKKGAYW
jgi:homospermidine synthase